MKARNKPGPKIKPRAERRCGLYVSVPCGIVDSLGGKEEAANRAAGYLRKIAKIKTK